MLVDKDFNSDHKLRIDSKMLNRFNLQKFSSNKNWFSCNRSYMCDCDMNYINCVPTDNYEVVLYCDASSASVIQVFLILLNKLFLRGCVKYFNDVNFKIFYCHWLSMVIVSIFEQYNKVVEKSTIIKVIILIKSISIKILNEEIDFCLS